MKLTGYCLISSDAGWFSWEKREPAHIMMFEIFIQDPSATLITLLKKKNKVFTAWYILGHIHSQSKLSVFQVNKALRKKSWPSYIVQDEGSYLKV